MHLDKNGLPINADGDAGDSLQRVYMWWIGSFFTGYRLKPTNVASPSDARALLENEGIWIRNNSPSEAWWANPKTTSRDQLIPVIIYYGWADRGTLIRLFDRVLCRGLFAQNVYGIGGSSAWKLPDFMGLHMGLFIRSFKFKWLYPVLYLLDLIQLIGMCGWLVTLYYDRDNVDDNNQVLQALQAKLTMPTLFSWLSRQLYVALRPKNTGNMHSSVLSDRYLSQYIKDPTAHPIVAALNWYHSRANGGNEEFAELYSQIIKENLL